MKIYFIIVISAGFVAVTFAQSVDKQVVATSGNTVSNTTTKLTSTIGEPVTGLKSNTVSINQGFLAGATGGETLSVIELVAGKTVKIYPNPVTDIVNITLEKNTEVVSVTIYDATGRQVANHTVNSASQRFNISHLANGMYLVQLQFKASNTIKSFKIIKK